MYWTVPALLQRKHPNRCAALVTGDAFGAAPAAVMVRDIANVVIGHADDDRDVLRLADLVGNQTRTRRALSRPGKFRSGRAEPRNTGRAMGRPRTTCLG